MVGRQKFPINHDVHALAGRHHGRHGAACGLAVHLAQAIHPDTGGIDHRMRPHGEFLAAHRVAADEASHLAVVVHQRGGRAIVHHQGTQAGGRARQRQRQAGVVKLAVPVLHAALEALRARRGQALERAFFAEKFGGTQACLAGQGVVHLEPDAVERGLPETVGRHDERQRLRQVRRVVQQRGALVQRLAHQGDVALGQVAHATVHQLGGAGRRSLGEIVRINQNHGKTPCGRVHSHPEAGGTPSDDRQVVLDGLGQAGEQVDPSCGQGEGVAEVMG